MWVERMRDGRTDVPHSLYNAVGDAVPCQIRGSRVFTGRQTGPIQPGHYLAPGDAWWRGAWYNPTVRCANLTEVVVEFMDGAETVISTEEELAALLANTSDNEAARRCMSY